MIGRWCALVVAVFVMAAAPASAAKRSMSTGEQRFALVIGNGAYPDMPLSNPVNDARAMATVLHQLGFEVIIEQNATQQGMLNALKRFSDRLQPNSVGLFYYSGHGGQHEGKNYMLPVDFREANARRLPLDAVAAELVLQQMETAQTRMNIVIFDACRKNLIDRSSRGVGRGLALMEAPLGSIIAFATSPNKTASDGVPGGNGVYTTQLLRAMQIPGLPLTEVFEEVRDAVARQTNEEQVPWEQTSLRGKFYFTAAGASVSGAAYTPAPTQPAYSAPAYSAPAAPAPANVPQPAAQPAPQQTASLAPAYQAPSASTPAEILYATAHGDLERKNYSEAASGFQRLINFWPNDPLIDQARYYLGETYYLQGQYIPAADAYLTAYETNKSSSYAQKTLLELGLSLSSLNKVNEACSTFRELQRRFAGAPEAIRADQEVQRLNCNRTAASSASLNEQGSSSSSVGEATGKMAEARRSVWQAVERAQAVRKQIASAYSSSARSAEQEAQDVWGKQGGQEAFRLGLSGQKGPVSWRPLKITSDKKYGFFVNNEGTLCETEVRNGQRHGVGVCWNAMYLYEGEFRNGGPSGWARVTVNGVRRYEGQGVMSNGAFKYQGYGIAYDETGRPARSGVWDNGNLVQQISAN